MQESLGQDTDTTSLPTTFNTFLHEVYSITPCEEMLYGLEEEEEDESDEQVIPSVRNFVKEASVQYKLDRYFQRWKPCVMHLSEHGLLLKESKESTSILMGLPRDHFAFVEYPGTQNTDFTIIRAGNLETLFHVRVTPIEVVEWRDSFRHYNVKLYFRETVLTRVIHSLFKSWIIPPVHLRSLAYTQLEQKAVTEWTSVEVKDWLYGLHFVSGIKEGDKNKILIKCMGDLYGDVFYDNEIDGECLLSLVDDKVLKEELQVTKFKHRKFLHEQICQLRSTNQYCAKKAKVWNKLKQLDSDTIQFLAPHVNTLSDIQLLKSTFLDFGTFQQETKIKVKLVITEIIQEESKKLLRRLCSSIANQTVAFNTTFGLFHTALIIGPWYLEWNSSAICVPRKTDSKSALLGLDLCTVELPHMSLELLQQVIAEHVVNWNINKTYWEMNVMGEDARNCQHFVEALLHKLNIRVPNQRGTIVGEYLERMKQNGICDMVFKADKQFRERFALSKSYYCFASHEELDRFVLHLQKQCPEFEEEYCEHWRLLKAFDRAFWLRFIAKNNVDKTTPLMSSEIFACNCPFEDPRTSNRRSFRA